MAATPLLVSEAAALVGVSDDTIRRWADAGRLDLEKGESGRLVVDGAQLARVIQAQAEPPRLGAADRTSNRNRFTGIITRITRDTVMAQVELQAGPFRVVSLISREAVDELGLEVGTVRRRNDQGDLGEHGASVRRRPALLAAAALALSLAGCTSAAPEPAPSPDASEPAPTLTGAVVVYAAASLTESFAAVSDAFTEANPGVSVTYNFGGSAALASAITSGAPVDVFAAASDTTMQTVAEADLVDGDPVVFARNILQIAVPTGNPGGITGLRDFADPAKTIALCAPEVPCGAASETVLAAAGVTAAPDTLEQDVKAALTKVELGEVDAALVYRTDVLAAPDTVEGIEFAEAGDAINDYPIAVLAGSPNPAAAAAFVEFVLGEDGQAILANAGFQAE